MNVPALVKISVTKIIMPARVGLLFSLVSILTNPPYNGTSRKYKRIHSTLYNH